MNAEMKKTLEMLDQSIEKVKSMTKEEIKRRKDAQKSDEKKQVPFYLSQDEVVSALPKEDQVKADLLYIASKILKRDPRELNLYDSLKSDSSSELSKAMHSEAGSAGGDWVPTGFSKEFIETMKLDLKVAALHSEFDMPTNPYIFPVKTSGVTAYYIRHQSTTGSAIVESSADTASQLQFTARKLGARVDVTTDLDEEAIIPMLPMIRKELAVAMAEAKENVTINGQFSGSIDTGLVSHSQEWVLDGYRKSLQTAAMVSAGGGTVTYEMVKELIVNMGKWAIDPKKLAWVVSPSVYAQFTNLDELTTVDKLGPKAVILAGQIASLRGVPVIVSEYVPENENEGGSIGGTVTDRTEAILVYRPGWRYGNFRNPTLKTQEDIVGDYTTLVSTMKLAFSAMYGTASNYIVGAIYNIAS